MVSFLSWSGAVADYPPGGGNKKNTLVLFNSNSHSFA